MAKKPTNKPPRKSAAKAIPRERPPRAGQRNLQAEGAAFGKLVKKHLGGSLPH
jgi:hypothetical protein